MALVNFTANFSLLVSVLERGVRALERMAGPEPDIDVAPRKKRGPESIVTYGNGDREWAKDHFRREIHEQGFAPEREDALLKVAIKRYDYETRHQNPNDAEMEG